MIFLIHIKKSMEIHNYLVLFYSRMKQTLIKLDVRRNSNQNINQQGHLDINENIKYFMGGFVEGEGSFSVSVVVSKSYKYGVRLEPVFNLTQHKDGIHLLETMRALFKDHGKLFGKSGSENVLVYELKNLVAIRNILFPYFDVYVLPFSAKQDQWTLFFSIIEDFEKGVHLTKPGLCSMVEKVYSHKSAKGKARKRSLEEVLYIINNTTDYFDKNNHTPRVLNKRTHY